MTNTITDQPVNKYTYDYPRPAVTVDIILFTFYDNDLKVLLNQRFHLEAM